MAARKTHRGSALQGPLGAPTAREQGCRASPRSAGLAALRNDSAGCLDCDRYLGSAEARARRRGGLRGALAARSGAAARAATSGDPAGLAPNCWAPCGHHIHKPHPLRWQGPCRGRGEENSSRWPLRKRSQTHNACSAAQLGPGALAPCRAPRLPPQESTGPAPNMHSSERRGPWVRIGGRLLAPA